MNPLEQALLWLDADRVRFWAVAWGAFFAVTALALFPPQADASVTRRRLNAGLFAAGVILALAAFRWPVWFFPQHLNPDEAQIVAGAITLDQFPVYWKYVDGTTHGPVCEYLLLAAHWLGAPLGYGTARIIATLLQAGALLAVWGTLRHFASERVARTGVLPGLAFWAFVSWDDFVHYATELPGVLLLAVAGWLGASVLRARPAQPRHFAYAILAGLCLGTVPFAKLQSVPQAVATALIVLGVLAVGRRDLTAKQRWRLGGVFVAGGLAPAAVVAGFVALYGLGEHFRVSYIQSALEYVGHSERSFAEMPLRFLHFSSTEPAFALFFWVSLAFALIYVRSTLRDRMLHLATAAAWLLAVVAYYSVLRPAREVAHYLHLLVIPMTTLAGLTLAAAVTESATEQTRWRRTQPWLVFALLTVGLQCYPRLLRSHRFAGHFQEYRIEPVSAAARFIRAHAQPDDTIAMWGWEPHLLVETGLPHGTREAHSANQIMQWPLQHYYRTRYLWDMERRQPAWFVDVVGPGSFAFQDRPKQAHGAMPDLAAYVNAHYQLLGEIGHRRIYRRKNPGTP